MPRILTPADVARFRERLCDVAAQLYAETGPEGFNMRQMAARVGVSAMTPYRYFRNKDEILCVLQVRALDRLAAQLEEALAEAGAPALGQAYLRFALEERINYRLIFDLFSPQDGSRSERARAEQRVCAVFAAHVRLRAESGMTPEDCELAGQLFWSSLHGAVALHLSGRLEEAALPRLIARAMTDLNPVSSGTPWALPQWQYPNYAAPHIVAGE